jgi:hypothetical protein
VPSAGWDKENYITNGVLTAPRLIDWRPSAMAEECSVICPVATHIIHRLPPPESSAPARPDQNILQASDVNRVDFL